MSQNDAAAQRSAHVTRGPSDPTRLAPWAERAIRTGVARLDCAIVAEINTAALHDIAASGTGYAADRAREAIRKAWEEVA